MFCGIADNARYGHYIRLKSRRMRRGNQSTKPRIRTWLCLSGGNIQMYPWPVV